MNTDIAEEKAKLTEKQILQESLISFLTQINQSTSDMTLQLLGGLKTN